MGKLIDVKSTPIQETIETLLQDKTTGKNIIWAITKSKSQIRHIQNP